MKAYLLVLLALVAVGCSTTPSTTPEAIALRYFHASSDRQWDSTATLVDKNDMADFQKDMNVLLGSVDSLGARIPGILEQDPFLTGLHNLRRENVSPEEFFSACLKVAIPLKSGDVVPPDSKPAFIPLGVVKDGNDTAYVVTKVVVPGDDSKVRRIIMLSMAQNGGQWKVLLQNDILGSTKGRLVRILRSIDEILRQRAQVKKGKK